MLKKILWKSFIEGIGKTTGSAVVLGIVYSLYKLTNNLSYTNKEYIVQNNQDDINQDNDENIDDIQCIQDIENFIKDTKDVKEYNYKRLFDKL